MRLPAFEYRSPESLDELLRIKAELGPAGAVLAGGTDLLVRLKQRLVKPEVVISLKKVDELKQIEADPINLAIGAGVTLDRVLADETVQAEFPGLHEAVGAIGHDSCQHHSATIGGNLLLQPRCLFYNQSEFWRQGHERCFKAGGQVCLALPESKECSCASLGDGAIMLLALSAQVKLASAGGERLIPIAQLFTGKGEEPFNLGQDEVLVDIRLPRPAGRTGSAYEKLSYRSFLDFALVSAAAFVSLNGKGVGRARLSIGGAGPAPLLVEEIGPLLRGQTLNQDLIAQAAEAAERAAAGRVVDNAGANPEYRRRMVGVMTARALSRAQARALET